MINKVGILLLAAVVTMLAGCAKPIPPAVPAGEMGTTRSSLVPL